MSKNNHEKKNVLRDALIKGFVFVLVLSIGSLLFIHTLYGKNFPRYDKPEYVGYLEFSNVPDYAHQVVKFPSGKNSLTGYIFGEENTKGLVVVAPGRGEGVERYLPTIMYFVDHGWRVFSFDYTGTYSSGGDNSVGLPQSRIDLEAALVYLESNSTLSSLPVMLWGHSWGGYAVTAIMKDHSDISAVASISGFNSPAGLMDEYVRAQSGALGYILYPFEWLYQALRFGRSAMATAVDGINSTDTPVMVIHGSADDSIFYNGASIITRRGQITNPHVFYRTCDKPNHNGHKDLLLSEAAVQYINQKNQEYQGLIDRYDGVIPANIRAEFYAGVDRFRTSEVNADLMNEINNFFESALPQ